MKTSALLLLVCLASFEAVAQLEVSAGTGIGWYSMAGFKAFQDDLRTQFPVDAQITEKFPAYLIYNTSIQYKFKSDQFFGLSHQYGSTAGRIYYEDYSGKVYMDELLHYNMLSLNMGGIVEMRNNFAFRIDLHPGVAFSKLELVSVTKVGEQQYKDSQKLHSITPTIQPTCELVKLWGSFGVKAFAGFNFGVYPGKLKPKGSHSYLINKDQSKVVADWNGLRVGLSGVYVFSKGSKKE